LLAESGGEGSEDIYVPDDDPCLLSTRHTKDVISGLLNNALIHANKIASLPPNGPHDNENAWKKEVKAALERARRLATKRLKGKTRDKILSEIDRIAGKAGVTLSR
jgi:hypothetical protein